MILQAVTSLPNEHANGLNVVYKLTEHETKRPVPSKIKALINILIED